MRKFFDIDGVTQDFDAAIRLADEDLLESVEAKFNERFGDGFCGFEADQTLIEMYAEAHEERFGEEWVPFFGGER